jgi:HSP20 family molecular chaperone IbpA
MNVANEIQLGKKYSLARAVVQMEDFTAAELTALTGVTPSTVEHFIHTLSKQHQVRKVSLAANGRGRPRKSYRLSEKGKEQLLRYMRQIRLKIEPDAVPFPDLEYSGLRPVQNEPNYPAISVYEADLEYVVLAAVPGLEQEDLEVSVEDGRLTLQGTMQRAPLRFLTPKHVEYELASFRRDIDLPSALTEDAVQKQTLRNGVLTIELKKAAVSVAMASNRTGQVAAVAKVAAKT